MHPITAMINAAAAANVEQYARKKDAPGQRDLFSGSERRSSKTQGKLRWITLKGEDGSGGAHVQINGDGDIVKGPAALAEKGIKNLNDFGKGDEKKPKSKKKSKPKKQTPFERANSPENRKAVESFYDEGVGASTIKDVEEGRGQTIDTTDPEWQKQREQRVAERKRGQSEPDRLGHESDAAYFKRKMFEDEDDSNLRNVSQRRDYFRAVVQGIKRRESTDTWKSDEQREHNLNALEGYEHELRLLDDLEERLSADFDAEYEVLGILGDHRGKALSGTDIAQKLNVQPRHIDVSLRQLASEGEIERVGDDEYRMVDDEPSPARKKAQERSREVNADDGDNEPSLTELQAERKAISDRHIWDNAMSTGATRPAPPDTSELDANIGKAKEREGKQLWQRTRDAVNRVTGMPEKKHRKLVEDALKQGKDVPAEVLADYPDLQTASDEAAAEEPKRRMKPVTFRHSIAGAERDVTVKSHLEYKGHKIVNPHRGSFVVLDADGNKVTEMAGVGGATRYLDKIESQSEPDESTEQTSDESEAPIRPAISGDELPYDRAKAAHAGSSFVPDERAKAEQKDYENHLNAVWDEVSALAESEPQQLTALSEFERYREGMLKRQLAYLDARSRTMSTMITGPSNFPTRRNQKRLDTAHRRLEELLDYSKKAQRAMKRNIANAATPEQQSAAAQGHIDKQVHDIIGTMKAFEAGDMRGSDPALFKSSFLNRFSTAVKDASPETVQSALDQLDKLQTEHLKKPAFTKRHSIWKMAEHAKNRVEAEKSRPTGAETVHEVAGHSVERDHDDDRVRIFFDGKPDAEVRQSLKSSGWRWSPRNSAWQRKNTANSVASAKSILTKHFGEAETEAETEDYSRITSMINAACHEPERYGQGSLFDESKHPRASDGRFGNKAGEHGGKAKEPKRPPKSGHKFRSHADVPMGEADFTVDRVENGKAYVSNEHGHNQSMPEESLQHFVNDMQGKVESSSQTENDSVNAVLGGSAKFLGKGDDGLVFDSGDGNVVKVSTTVPYIWTNPFHRTPGDAAKMLADQAAINNEMMGKGIPGLLPQQSIEHEGRTFVVRPKVNIPEKFTPAQLEEARQTITAMHDAGYALNDQVQIGIGSNGKVYHFDTGKAGPLGEEMQKRFNMQDDRGAMRRLYEDSGVEPPDNLSPERVKNQYEESLAAVLDRFDGSEDGSPYSPSMAKRALKQLEDRHAAVKAADPDFLDWHQDTHDELTAKLKQAIGDRAKPAAAAPEPEAPKTPKKPGVQGMQMGLFDEEPSGQKTLFNVAQPSKKKKTAKPAAQLSLLEQITDQINQRAKEMAPSLDGQKTMFSRPGEPEHYDMPGQRDLMTGQERRSSKTQGKLRWVTIGGHADGEKQHAGGNAVLIDGEGNIVGGNVPKGWQGKHIGDTHKLDDKPEGVPVSVKQMNNGRWYAMADLPDGDQVTRSHPDREAALQAATNDIQRRGHQVREQTPQESAGTAWTDPPLETSPGLSEADARIERETQERARREYPKLRDAYAKLMGTFDGDGNLKSIQFNTDEWRGLFPEYRGTNAHTVHEASSYLNKRFLAEALQTMKGVGNNSVLLLAGGGGSGKGSATKKHLDQSQYPIVIDQVSDKLEKSNKAIDQAKEHGFSAEVAFVDRHPEDAWRGGVVPRAVGARERGGLARTVPLDVALQANINARKAALELLQSDPDAKVNVINNNVGPGLAYMIKDRDEAIEFLSSQNHDFDTLREKLANETRDLHERGIIPDDIAQGLLPGGSAPDGRVQPGRAEGGDSSGQAAESAATGGTEGAPDEGAAHRPAVGGSGSSEGVSVPGEFGFSTAGELKRDPERFQYKQNTNKAGVTDQFADIQYNPMFGGVLHVWSDPDNGETYVVNGHHRHELAERSGHDGQMPVFHMKASTAKEARAYGALVNIAGGNGTAVDAAKFMRDMGVSLEDMQEKGVSITQGVAKDAGILAKLSPRLFDKVSTGLMRQGRAIAIAQHVDDHDSQERIAKQIDNREERGGRSISDTIVGEIARQNALSSKITESQPDLFGEQEVQRDLDVERADLVTAVRRQITNRLNKFKAVSNDKAAETLEGHNTIDAAANRQESKRLTGRLDDFNRESAYRGAVSDIINRHAEALADEPKRRNEIVGQLAAELESHFAPVRSDVGTDGGTDRGQSEAVGSIDEAGADQERHQPLPGQRAFFSRRMSETSGVVMAEAIRAQVNAAFAQNQV